MLPLRESDLSGILFLFCMSVCLRMYCVLNTDKILFTSYQKKLDLERQKAFPGQFAASFQRDMKWLTGGWESRGEGRTDRRGHTLKHLQLNKIKRRWKKKSNETRSWKSPTPTFFFTVHTAFFPLLTSFFFCLLFSPGFVPFNFLKLPSLYLPFLSTFPFCSLLLPSFSSPHLLLVHFFSFAVLLLFFPLVSFSHLSFFFYYKCKGVTLNNPFWENQIPTGVPPEWRRVCVRETRRCRTRHFAWLCFNKAWGRYL